MLAEFDLELGGRVVDLKQDVCAVCSRYDMTLRTRKEIHYVDVAVVVIRLTRDSTSFYLAP